MAAQGQKRTSGEDIDGVWDGKADGIFVSHGDAGYVYFLTAESAGADFNLYPVLEGGIIDPHESNLDPEGEILQVIKGYPHGVLGVHWAQAGPL